MSFVFVEEMFCHQTMYALISRTCCGAISVCDKAQYGYLDRHQGLHDLLTSIVLSICGRVDIPRNRTS